MTTEDLEKAVPICTCARDGFAALPAELRPRVQKTSNLRKVTCPGCGLTYWTNRATDWCIECAKKSQHGDVHGG